MGAGFSATGTFKPPAPTPETGSTPPAPLIDLAEFQRAAIEIGLVDAPTIERYAQGAAGDVARLARSLVQAGYLSAYQAGALAQGKAKGLVIGSYLVLDKRGQGGMGVVFKARHRESGQLVALKILLPSFGRDGEAVLRFRREFELAAQLKHPNVVSALEADEDRGVQFLTMEYVEGHDLEDMVREVGPLPIKTSLHCVIQAARGLAAAHAQGIVHRDVKPGNLMLDPSGGVRVLDLGLARVMEASNPLGRVAGASLTQSGAYMGTVDFIAPEQANDSKKADHHADVYSLGCTLYFLLTGRPPFEGETILKRLMAHQQEPAPSLHSARDDVPAALEAAYQTMMAKRPTDRPRSMAEVIDLLEACRSSANEAKQARADLKTFAQTFLKRASPRKRDRSPDASVFARRAAPTGLEFDPDLNLEDLVMDYRDETKVDPLTDEQLPPIMPRIATVRRGPRRSPVVPGLGLLALIGLTVAGFVFRPRGELVPTSPPSPPPTSSSTTNDKELPASSTPSSKATPPASVAAPPAQPVSDVLFADDYSVPRSYWSATTPEQLADDPNHFWGHREGVYFNEARAGNTFYFDGHLPDGPYSDFSCEVVGRVTGDKPSSMGSMVIHIRPEGRGFQVRIDGRGHLFVEPNRFQDETEKSAPWIGPIINQAVIKPGGAEFNTVRLQVAKRRVEIFVNSVKVCPTLTFDWDVTPAFVSHGVDCKEPIVRAEYDRIEIKRLPKSTLDSLGGEVDPSKTIRVTQGGGMIMPEGTWVFEGSNLKVVEKSGGDASPQTVMDNFPDFLWSCDRQLYWIGTKKGDVLSLEIPVEADGNYQVFGRFTRAVDFGQSKLDLDGKPLMGGNFIDLFSPDVRPTDLLPLGFVSIANGKAILKVTIVGKNRAATQFRFGLDEIRFVPVR
jgi:serine/threonine protein kinase